MKTISLSLFILTSFTKIFSQDSIFLHTAYLPNHKYEQSVEQKFHIVIKYIGNDSVMRRLKDKGITNPLTDDKGTSIKGIITTGNSDSNNIMPVQLEFAKAQDKEGNTLIPAGTKMTGTIVRDKMPVYDSVISNKMDEETKESFLKSFKNILSQIPLPTKRMAIGDTFNYTTPLSFPMGSVSFKMLFSTTYKLISFDDKTINFNIQMNYTLDMNTDILDATGGGKGSGVLVIDRRNEYPLRIVSDYYINLNAAKDGASMHAVVDGSSDSENVIDEK